MLVRSLRDEGRDVAVAFELGVDGVLMNTAIAEAKDPILMAAAMKAAVEAGRLGDGSRFLLPLGRA